MILTPHAIVGASLTNIFANNPAFGFSMAFFSHYVLDVLPHTDYNISNFLNSETKTVKSIFKNTGAALHFLFIIIDFLLAVLFCVLLFVRDEKSLIITFLGVIGGILPDFFQFLYYKYKRYPWISFQKIHDKIHHILVKDDNEKSLFFSIFGIVSQFVMPTIFFAAYYFLNN